MVPFFLSAAAWTGLAAHPAAASAAATGSNVCALIGPTAQPSCTIFFSPVGFGGQWRAGAAAAVLKNSSSVMFVKSLLGPRIQMTNHKQDSL